MTDKPATATFTRTYEVPLTFNSIEEIKRANRAAGGHWFEPSAMRWFGSRILDGVYGGRYFVTSERFMSRHGDGPRLYSIRVVNPDGTIDTVGEFQQYTSARAARREAMRIAAAAERE